MTDHLRHLLRTEASAVDVPPPPVDTVLAGGRRRRQRRQAGVAVGVAACVLAAVAGGVAVARLGAQDEHRSISPAPAPTLPAGGPTPTPTAVPTGAERLQVSGEGIAGQPFGTPRQAVIAAVTDRFGEPDLVVRPKVYVRISGEDGYFDSPDNLSPRWRYRVLSVSCWQSLCLLFGGQDADDLALRGWEVAELRRWATTEEPPAGPGPGVRLAGTDVGLGSRWTDVHAAFPGTRVSDGEGGSLVVADLPWDAVADGVGEWRLSGYLDVDHPGRAPADSVVTRLSGGEGPQPGCC